MTRRYSRTYGSNSELILTNMKGLGDLGEDFGHDLYEAELRYLVEKEWAVTLDDVIWRRTKLGMRLNDAQKQRISDWLAHHRQQQMAKAG